MQLYQVYFTILNPLTQKKHFWNQWEFAMKSVFNALYRPY